MTYIDHSVYPDYDEPPTSFETPYDMADYVRRICSAWDFGIHPEQATFQLFATWRDIFDRFPVATSPAYHAFRDWFGWPQVPFPPGMPTIIPQWLHMDRLEGRPPDPCEDMA